MTSPKDAFKYIPESMTPRAFRVDYSRGLQKKLTEREEEVKQVSGGIIMVKHIEKKKEAEEDEDRIGPEGYLEFTVLNPAEILTK